MIIKLISPENINVLYSEWERVIEEYKKDFKKNIQDLKLEKPLTKYCEIGIMQTHNSFCYPSVSKELPDWTIAFLFECYRLA